MAVEEAGNIDTLIDAHKVMQTMYNIASIYKVSPDFKPSESNCSWNIVLKI